MAETEIRALLVAFMLDTAVLAGVPLAVATITGFVVSALQAITQIQDQTLNQTIKIVAIAVCLLVFGNALVAPLLSSTEQLFTNFWAIGG